MKHWWDHYAFYEDLWKRKAKNRPYKAINRNGWQKFQLWREGDVFQIKVYWPHQSGGEGGPLLVATVDSTSKWTVYPSVLGRVSFVYWAYKHLRLRVRNKADRRRSCQQWIYADNGKQPCFDGMQIQARRHLNPEALEQKVRKIVYEKAKPLRLKAQPWEKLGRTYFTLGDAEALVDQFIASKSVKPPDLLVDDPSPGGVMSITRAHVRYGPWWMRYGQHSASPADKAWFLKRLSGHFRGALEKWREQQYEKAGAFIWVPLDKTA